MKPDKRREVMKGLGGFLSTPPVHTLKVGGGAFAYVLYVELKFKHSVREAEGRV